MWKNRLPHSSETCYVTLSLYCSHFRKTSICPKYYQCPSWHSFLPPLLSYSLLEEADSLKQLNVYSIILWHCDEKWSYNVLVFWNFLYIIILPKLGVASIIFIAESRRLAILTSVDFCPGSSVLVIKQQFSCKLVEESERLAWTEDFAISDFIDGLSRFMFEYPSEGN